MSSKLRVSIVVVVAACTHPAAPRGPHAMTVPTPSVAVGACADPGHDGVMGAPPRAEHADRDLDGDGRAERIVVDRAMCTPDGNCYWNVFTQPAGECARFAGTFAGAALEPLASRGEGGMSDVRGYWNLHGGRLLLQSYKFSRGGYQLVDAVVCKRAPDDRLECADTDR
jgi:hypothetical protein